MSIRGLFIGLTTIDIQYYVDEFPNPNTKVKTHPPTIFVGGPSANAAVAFARLNGQADLLTAVGENPFSSIVKSDFEAYGVQYIDACGNQEFKPVIASVVTSVNGDRTIFSHNPPQLDVDCDVCKWFDLVQPDAVMLDGFYPEFTVKCAQEANRRGISVIIDGGSWKPQYTAILPYTTAAILSADFCPPGCKNYDDVFQFVAKSGVKRIAISRGAQSILVQENEKRSQIEVEKVKVVDTLGAGDFLHGAFCFYFHQKNDFTVALQLAAQISSKSCCFKGTRQWLNFS